MLLAVGLIGSGMLAVPILTASAAYGVADAFGWKSGTRLQARASAAVLARLSERAVMGARTSGRLLASAGWITTLVMGIAAIALIVVTVFPSL